MGVIWVDIETRSRVDLRNTTPYRYAEDSEFNILMAGWSTDGTAVHMALGEEQVRSIPGLRDPDVLKVAHNAAFERVCFSRFFGLPLGTYLPPEEWHDTQAIAGELGYPQKLEKLAPALGAEEKDAAGTRLINLFCKPNRSGEFNQPEDYPVEWLDFVAYCEQDVHTLIDVDRQLGRWNTETERQVYLADQRINDRGIRIDVELAHRARDAAEDNRMVQELELSELTGVINPGSTGQLLKWLQDSGLLIGNLQAETVAAKLAGELGPDQRRVLELRQELALIASKKFSTALESVSTDDRLRGSFRFFGAHTGRWAGRGTQLHNLPRAQLADETATDAAILDLQLGAGGDAYTLKALVRALFVGPFGVVDYAAIEARILAWLAGEDWALAAFRAGRDIYAETAERMGGLSRAQGKVAVLALGYNGGRGSLRAMGYGGKDGDETLDALVQQWRRANPAITRLWKTMEVAFRMGGPVGPRLTIERDGTDRYMRLPSGRALGYHGCEFGRRTTFSDPKRGVPADTYGGRLVENATQAVARDVLAEALVRLDHKGYEVVGHVHDEIIVEDTEVGSVRDIMTEAPSWAAGLPIDGEGFVCRRYRKG